MLANLIWICGPEQNEQKRRNTKCHKSFTSLVGRNLFENKIFCFAKQIALLVSDAYTFSVFIWTFRSINDGPSRSRTTMWTLSYKEIYDELVTGHSNKWASYKLILTVHFSQTDRFITAKTNNNLKNIKCCLLAKTNLAIRRGVAGNVWSVSGTNLPELCKNVHCESPRANK